MEVVYFVVYGTKFIDEIRTAQKMNFKVIEFGVKGSFDKDEIDCISTFLNKNSMKSILHLDEWLTQYNGFKTVQTATYKELKEIILLNTKLNFNIVGIHLDTIYLNQKHYQEAVQRLSGLIEFAHKHNVIIAGENGFTSIEFLEKITRDLPQLGLLFDVGHANLHLHSDYISSYISKFFDKISHIHIHDNFGYNYSGNSDLHLPIGLGNMNWKAILKELKSRQYDKTISIEIKSEDKNYILYNKYLIEKEFGIHSIEMPFIYNHV